MISTRLEGLVIDTVISLTLAKWETLSGSFRGYLNKMLIKTRRAAASRFRVITVAVR